MPVTTKAKLQRLFTQSILNESSAFKNIVALNQGDIRFLEDIGLFIMEGFKKPLKDIIQRAEMDSNVYEQLKKQSQLYLKGQPFIYWNQPEDDESEPVGLYLATVVRSHLKKGKIFKRNLDPERVVLYLPILEDWISYYLNSNNEGLERQLVLRCLSMPLQGQRSLKYVVMTGTHEEFSDELSDG